LRLKTFTIACSSFYIWLKIKNIKKSSGSWTQEFENKIQNLTGSLVMTKRKDASSVTRERTVFGASSLSWQQQRFQTGEYISMNLDMPETC